MDKINIEGGQALKGTVEVGGAKNAVLPILAATLLTDEKCVIKNVPPLKDGVTMLKILKELGVRTHYCEGSKEIIVEPRKVTNHVAPYRLVSQMRASFCVWFICFGDGQSYDGGSSCQRKNHYRKCGMRT